MHKSSDLQLPSTTDFQGPVEMHALQVAAIFILVAISVPDIWPMIHATPEESGSTVGMISVLAIE